MGQLCSNCSKEESQKINSFKLGSSSSDPLVHDVQDAQTLGAIINPISSPHATSNTQLLESVDCVELDVTDDTDCQRRLIEYGIEQAELSRREAIVSAASQTMVPMGSQGSSIVVGGHHRMAKYQRSNHGAGGVNTYYDPIYAAAAAQDILRSASITGGLVFFADEATKVAWNTPTLGVIPLQDSSRLANSKDLVDFLGRGIWDSVRLGSRGSGLAGCGGEDPEYYLDDLAEALQEKIVPTKTSLLGGHCKSIIENLP